VILEKVVYIKKSTIDGGVEKMIAQLTGWDDYDGDEKCARSECYLNAPDNTLQVDLCCTGCVSDV
jgi:hypothetical protein